MKSLIKSCWPYILSSLIIFSVAIYYLLTNSGVQVFDYDMIEQGVHFVLHGYNWFENGMVPLWDWNHYMGASVFTHGFYWLFSPFWLLFLLLNNIDKVPYFFMWVNLLKHLLLFNFSIYYLSTIRNDKVSAFVGASIITFSGFALGYYNYSHFIDVFLFVPLALLGIERLFTRKSIWLFILSICFMAIINGYLLYLFTPFFFIYFVFRYLEKNRNTTIKNLIKPITHFLFLYTLCIGLVAFIFLPSLSTMLGSSRLTANYDLLSVINWKDAFRYITGFIQPIVDRNNFNPLVNKYIVPSYGWSGGAAVYSLIISPILFTQLISIKQDVYHERLILWFFSLLIIFSIFPAFYFLLQGNFDSRWMVYYSLLFAYIISYIIDNFNAINKKTFWITCILLLLSIAVSYKLSRYFGLQNNELYFSIAKRNVIVIGSIILFYFILFTVNFNTTIKKYLLILIIVFESYFSLFNIFLNPIDSVSMTADKLNKYQLTNTAAIDYIQETDDSFYRIDVINDSGFNDPMSKDYMGFGFYTSVYNFNVDPFIQNNVASAGGWIVGSNQGKWLYKNLFGAKYWFDSTGNYNVPYGYTYLNTIHKDKLNSIIYKNEYAVPLMYIQTETFNINSWLNLNPYIRMKALMNNVVTNKSTNTEFIDKTDYLIQNSFSTEIEYSFDTSQNKLIVTAIYPRSDEVKMYFYLSDRLVDYIYSYEPQYSSHYIIKDFDKVVVKVTNLYGVPEEEFNNQLLIENPNTYFPEWYNNLMENSVTDINLGNNTFSGKVYLEEDAYLVTSIAYDKDWKLEVNGNPVEIENINGGFIGFKLQAGQNVFSANYFPSLLLIGIIMSIISSLLLLIYMFLNKKHHFDASW